MLFQIEARQRALMEKRQSTLKKVVPIRAYPELRAAHAKALSMTGETKVVGVQVPKEVNDRLEAFLAKTKGQEGLPASKKALALACIVKFLDENDKTQ